MLNRKILMQVSISSLWDIEIVSECGGITGLFVFFFSVVEQLHDLVIVGFIGYVIFKKGYMTFGGV